MADFVRERIALSVEPCLETHKTAKPAIHGRSVYNLHRPLTAKQPAQIHPGPLRGGEEQSNYILKQQSEARSACKQTSSTHTNTDRFRHKQYVCSRLCRVLLSFWVWICLAYLVLHMSCAGVTLLTSKSEYLILLSLIQRQRKKPKSLKFRKVKYNKTHCYLLRCFGIMDYPWITKWN